MKEGRPSAGDYIASLLSSSPRLDFGGEEEEEDCLDRFCGDPGFAARAARLSSFSGQRFAVTAGLFGLPPPLPAASGGGEFAGSREASSVSDPASVMKDANAKKRKAPAAAAAKGKGREPSAQVRVCFCLYTPLLELLLPRTSPPFPRLAAPPTSSSCRVRPGAGRGAEGSGRQEVLQGGGRRGGGGEPREAAQAGAGRQRQLRRGRRRRAEPEAAAGEGEECQAGGASQGLRPCPGQERAGYRQPQPRREGTVALIALADVLCCSSHPPSLSNSISVSR
jgi:hypothetical protein